MCNQSAFLFPAPKKVVQQAPDQFLISPITGEKIPVDKIQEHMRIGKARLFPSQSSLRFEGLVDHN